MWEPEASQQPMTRLSDGSPATARLPFGAGFSVAAVRMPPAVDHAARQALHALTRSAPFWTQPFRPADQPSTIVVAWQCLIWHVARQAAQRGPPALLKSRMARHTRPSSSSASASYPCDARKLARR